MQAFIRISVISFIGQIRTLKNLFDLIDPLIFLTYNMKHPW